MSLTRRQAVLATLAGVIASGASQAQARASGSDQLARLLGYEHRLEAGYRAALQHGAIDAALGRSLLAQEREHVRGVELALRSVGRQGPRPSSPRRPPGDALSGRAEFARFALALESQAQAAYVEVLATLDAPGLLQPLGSIMTSGAQHQVALRRAIGQPLLARGVA